MPSSPHDYNVDRPSRLPPGLVSPNLSIDLDSPTDLAAVRRHPDGVWIEDVIG
ncbi:MAG: hypothetical protein GXP36_04895 [Actinobacteria bacterium]|nr:hypothetical protein [Actinomycetota bacterium]